MNLVVVKSYLSEFVVAVIMCIHSACNGILIYRIKVLNVC